MTEGTTRVWKQQTTAYAASTIHVSILLLAVMVWECVSHDCKLDLVTVQGNLNEPRYQRDILKTIIVLHFDKYTLAT